MKPRLILLLLLGIMTITFMAFLVIGAQKTGVTCEQSKSDKQDEGGGVEMDNGSFNHLIVSTIK